MKRLFAFLRSLFGTPDTKSNASSSMGQPSQIRSVSVSSSLSERLQKKVDAWVKKKLYRVPCSTYDAVMAEMGMTKHQFQQYFDKVLKEDFRTWRTKLRVEEAKELLVSRAELSACKIATLVGFSDRSNFTRQFMKYVGMSPAEYRVRDYRTEPCNDGGE
jgi:two-component system response regulator YesN